MMHSAILAMLFILCTDDKMFATAAAVRGNCCSNEVLPMENFNWKKFSGRWFSVRASDSELLPRSCLQFLTSDVKDGSVEFTVGSFLPLSLRILAVRVSSLPLTSNSGKLRLVQNMRDVRSEFLDYLVLDSDYTHYAVAYLRANERNSSKPTERVIILSRTADFAEENEGRVNEVLQGNGLPSLDDLQHFVQDCGEFRCSKDDQCRYEQLPYETDILKV